MIWAWRTCFIWNEFCKMSSGAQPLGLGRANAIVCRTDAGQIIFFVGRTWVLFTRWYKLYEDIYYLKLVYLNQCCCAMYEPVKKPGQFFLDKCESKMNLTWKFVPLNLFWGIFENYAINQDMMITFPFFLPILIINWNLGFTFLG